MKNKKNLSLLIGILVLTLIGCGTKTEKAKTDDKPNVKLITATERSIDQKAEFTATVEPEMKNNIAPSTPGRIRKIFVKVGTFVSQGQKVAQMDAANLSNLEAQIENLKKVYKRIEGLYKVGGSSQQELDNAKLQLTTAETNFRNISENTYLISPISGVITAKNYDEGDLFNGQLPVLTVMQINPVKLKINVSESYYSEIKTGMPVAVKIDVFKNESFSGNVSLIYPTIDERTRTFGVEVKLNNPNNKIHPGMFARASMQFGQRKNIVIPDQSIVKQAGTGMRYVYIYENGVVKYQQIEIGNRIGNEFEIISGINDGDQVVIAGQGKLSDGAEVTVN